MKRNRSVEVDGVHRACDTCKWHIKDDDSYHWGVCYRNPPTAKLGDGYQESRHPQVHVNDFCGEWSHR